MNLTQQYEKAFFDRDGSRFDLPVKPTDDVIRVELAANNASCPLNKIIVSKENEGNMRILKRFAFTAYKRYNRSCRGNNFGIYCPSGQGKTFIVRNFAKTIGIPFVFVQSSALESTQMLFDQICNAFDKHCFADGSKTPIVPVKDNHADYRIPPCIVFFDEAHCLSNKLMKGGLLNAMEPDDGYMVIKQSSSKDVVEVVDCRHICWIGATTERGDLFDAFENRLTTAIEWKPATEEELPIIIHAGLESKYKSKEIEVMPSMDVCALISKYQQVPRLAIHGFGVKVCQQKTMFPNNTWEEACQIVAKDIGINDYGMTEKQVEILKALGQRPIAEPRLADVAKCRIAQVKRFELPGLMQYTNGGPLAVSVSGKGMCITRAGIQRLNEMGIPNKGEKITAEHFENRR